MRTHLAVSVLAALALAGSSLGGSASAAGAAPQVTDPAGDANFLNPQAEGALLDPVVVPENNSTPVGSQAYADVLSVNWAPVITGKGKKAKVTAFTVSTTLSAPPAPPSPTTLVFRMLGEVKGDASKYLGPVYYTAAAPGTPQSALRDNLGAGGVTRLTPLALPVIKGSTITWTVPIKALPKEFTVGDSVSNLYFEVRELESFQGQKIPDGVPSVGGATGLATGILDTGHSTKSFKIG